MTADLSGMDPRRHAAVRALLVREATAPSHRDAAPAHVSVATSSSTDSRSGRPSTWARPTRRRIGLALASVTAIAVTSAVVVIGDPTAPASYATWTPVPATPTTATAARGDADDEDINEQASRCTELTGARVAIGGVPERPEDAERRSVLVDRRGDWTYCVDITRGSSAPDDPLIVLSGLKGDDYQGTASTVWDGPFTWPTDTGARVLGGTPYAVPGEDPTTTNYSLIGALGPDVTGIDINLADGTSITTTIHDDFWAAWWPGRATTARVDTLTIHTTTGASYDTDPRTIQLPWAQYGGTTSDWP